jgi:hypothetical protein
MLSILAAILTQDDPDLIARLRGKGPGRDDRRVRPLWKAGVFDCVPDHPPSANRGGPGAGSLPSTLEPYTRLRLEAWFARSVDCLHGAEPCARSRAFGGVEASENVRVFIAPQQGFVFVGSGLPPIQSDRTFQLWLVPPSGAPQPAGLFRGQDSSAVYVSHSNVDLARTAAIAVSVEPQGGSAAPTTKPFRRGATLLNLVRLFVNTVTSRSERSRDREGAVLL